MATDCTRLAALIGEAIESHVEETNNPSLDAAVEEIIPVFRERFDVEVDREMMIESYASYVRHLREQRRSRELSALQKVRQEALVEQGIADRIAEVTARLEKGLGRPKQRKRRKVVNQSIERLLEIEKELKTKESLQEQIDGLQRVLESADYRDKEGRVKPERSAEVAGMIHQRDKLRREVQLRRQIEGLIEQLRTGRIEPPVPRPPTTDPTIARLEFEAQQKRRKIRQLQNDIAPQGAIKKYVGGASLFIKDILATADASAQGVQAWLATITRPMVAARAWKGGLRAAMSDRGEFAIQQAIENHPHYQVFVSNGGSITEPDADLTRQEENAMSRLARKIPILAHSQRFHRQFLNLVRLHLFSSMVNTYSPGGRPTSEEATAFTTFANEFTGRPDLRGKWATLKPAIAASNYLLFSGGLQVARAQVLTAGPVRTAPTARLRRLMALEYARVIVGVTSLLALAKLLHDDDEDEPLIQTDPTSSDFGRIRFQNVRVDVTGGLGSYIVMANRFFQGRTTRDTGVSVPLRGEEKPFSGWGIDQYLASFGFNKESPGFSLFHDLFTGELFGGKDPTLFNILAQYAGPISFQEIYGVMQSDLGIEEKTALSMLSMVGMVSAWQPAEVGPKARYLQDVRTKLMAKGTERRTATENRDYGAVLTGQNGWGGVYRDYRERIEKATAQGQTRSAKQLVDELEKRAALFQARLSQDYRQQKPFEFVPLTDEPFLKDMDKVPGVGALFKE